MKTAHLSNVPGSHSLCGLRLEARSVGGTLGMALAGRSPLEPGGPGVGPWYAMTAICEQRKDKKGKPVGRPFQVGVVGHAKFVVCPECLALAHEKFDPSDVIPADWYVKDFEGSALANVTVE